MEVSQPENSSNRGGFKEDSLPRTTLPTSEEHPTNEEPNGKDTSPPGQEHKEDKNLVGAECRAEAHTLAKELPKLSDLHQHIRDLP
ncbi:hypothetical protein Syun_012084 [Stephania yunnanensis]|uniref:Uncharacterized protein n=1 Tax=Stephania yunnanensis TaxID=152371 RepID=A0AAP0JZJ9_9MAGN